MPETFITGTGQELTRVHDGDKCMQSDQPCPIHKPSNHSMRDFPLHWRQFDGMITIKPSHFERICPHGIGHPDPDSLAYLVREGIDDGSVGVHGCDGCCRPKEAQ